MVTTVNADVITSTTRGVKLTLNNMQAGMPIAVNIIRNSERTALSVSNTGILFKGNFVKLRADSIIRATCTVFGAGYYSGNCGVGMVIDSNIWDYGCAYQYDGSWSATLQTTIICGTSQWSGLSQGPHSIGFGWKTFNGSATDKPFNYFNPNANDDPRNQQMISSIVVYEVSP